MTDSTPPPTGDPFYESRRDIALCRRCPLHEGRKNTVPGEGPEDAKIVLVGEAPGANEDDQGKPFVGQAGKKLNYWLEQAGLERDEVFVTNVLKCQPPENKFPEDSPDGPVTKCLPHLHQQLRLLNPLAIVVFGKHALNHVVLRGSSDRVLKLDEWVGEVLRRKDMFGETRIGVCFHPAYILRTKNPIEERKCVQTLKTISAYVASRRRGDQPAMIDLREIRPGSTPVFQQRFRLLQKRPAPTPPAPTPAPAPETTK